jgi:hypothetical protein
MLLNFDAFIYLKAKRAKPAGEIKAGRMLLRSMCNNENVGDDDGGELDNNDGDGNRSSSVDSDSDESIHLQQDTPKPQQKQRPHYKRCPMAAGGLVSSSILWINLCHNSKCILFIVYY